MNTQTSVTLIRDYSEESKRAYELLTDQELEVHEIYAPDEDFLPYMMAPDGLRGYEGLRGIRYFLASLSRIRVPRFHG